MTTMLQLFQHFAPPEQTEFNEKYGHDGLQDKDEAQLRKALKDNPTFLQATTSGGSQVLIKTKDLQKDVLDDTIKELKKKANSTLRDEQTNMELFDRKFVMQARRITEEVERVVVRESDRVIEAVTSGPHDRIIDKVRFVFFGQFHYEWRI